MGDARLNVKAVSRQPGSPSHQQRIEGYIDLLAERGIDVEMVTLPKGFFAQRKVIASLADADAVWWHRHLLSPVHVGLLARSARRLVYDFDDPLPLSSRKGGAVDRTRASRFARLLRQCDVALPASGYLAELAQPHCRDLRIVPMTIDPPPAEALAKGADEGQNIATVTLLWVGSRSTQPFLESIRPALESVGRERPDVSLRLVAHEPMTFDPLRVDFRPWSEGEQNAALRECSIGLCPMPDDPWTRGKCPFKVLQYMAHGMAWVGSAVGENLRMAGEGDAATGLCAADREAWQATLLDQIDNAQHRRTIGSRGRDFIAARHTRAVAADTIAAALRGST